MTTDRLHGLDALRSFALLLGVGLHATMSFWPGAQFWIVADTVRSEGMFITFYVIHIFRMATFFLLAGFFGRMIYHRYGAKRFIASRSKRIVLPLLIFWLPVMVLIVVCAVWAQAKIHGWPLPEGLEPPAPPQNVPLPFPLTHLWFLYVLIWLYAGMLLLRAPVAMIDRGGALRAVADKAAGIMTVTNLAPILLGLLTAAALYAYPYWFAWGGVPTPDNSLLPNTAALSVYGLAFFTGWLMQRRMDLLSAWRRRWPLNLVVAVGLTVLCWQLVQALPAMAPAPQTAYTFGYACAFGIAMWCWVFGLVGLAMALLDREIGPVRYLADASYWIYIIHLPLVMALQVALSDWVFPPAAKFAIILAVAIPLMLASYHWMVRNTFIGALLNGRRYPRKVPAAVPGRAEAVT